jgi:short-subunit dehydrogenase
MNASKATRVVVAGGTGGVGEGLVAAFARAGFEVLVPSRSEVRIASLLSALPPDARGRVRGEVVDMDHASTIERYRDARVASGGPIDAVDPSSGRGAASSS